METTLSETELLDLLAEFVVDDFAAQMEFLELVEGCEIAK